MLSALICAILMIGTFTLSTAGVVMPVTERWAALTTFGLLALAYALQGNPRLYDALGQTVRRDRRTLVPLLLLIPALYTSYSIMVNEFAIAGLLTSLAFVFMPALAFAQSRYRRTPTLFDLVATLYLLLSLELHLLPMLQLPQQGGQVGFFVLSAAPLLLLLLAARGWPGLGFTWFLDWRDLGVALPGVLGVLGVLVPLALGAGFVQPAVGGPSAFDALLLALHAYFFVALPQEIFFRGIIQNGIERVAEAKLWRGPGSQPYRRFSPLHPRLISLVLASLIAGGTYFYDAAPPPAHILLAIIASLGYGLVYQQTGKVTASGVTHALVIWLWLLFFV